MVYFNIFPFCAKKSFKLFRGRSGKFTVNNAGNSATAEQEGDKKSTGTEFEYLGRRLPLWPFPNPYDGTGFLSSLFVR
jgi:hypothetical protein